MNSFHDMIMACVIVTTKPGPARGKITRNKAPVRLQPSIRAASSISGGMESKYPFKRYGSNKGVGSSHLTYLIIEITSSLIHFSKMFYKIKKDRVRK